MNELVINNYEDMSDEQLEVLDGKITDIRLRRMSKEIKELVRGIELIKIEGEKSDGKIKGIEDTLKVTCIDRFEMSELDDLMKKRVFHFVGKIGSYKYILFFKGYKSSIMASTKRQFGKDDIALQSIKDMKKSDLEDAKNYIKRWNPDGKTTSRILASWQTKEINNEIKNTEQTALDWYMQSITLTEEAL